MKETTDLQPIIKKIAKIFRDNKVDYTQSKQIIKEVRETNFLTAPKDRRKGTVKRLSRDEYQSFVNTAYKASPLYGLMLMTLYETAARVDEFTNMDANDLMVEESRIVIKEGKGSKRREVPIEDHLRQALLVHLNGRTKGPLFLTTRNTRFTNRRIQQITKQVGREAGILKKTNPHVLRHTRATQLLEDGMHKDDVRDFLGHEKSETTEIYVRTAAKSLHESFKRVTKENKN